MALQPMSGKELRKKKRRRSAANQAQQWDNPYSVGTAQLSGEIRPAAQPPTGATETRTLILSFGG